MFSAAFASTRIKKHCCFPFRSEETAGRLVAAPQPLAALFGTEQRPELCRRFGPQNPEDVATLTALEDLYDKTGRSNDYLRVLERLAKMGTDTEKLRRGRVA